jgi:Flp pilus assembly protein TadG
MPSERRRALDDRDSGAVAVETALVSILLLTFIFGIVETSFLFKDWLVVSAAARAGARMGSSEPRVPNFAQDSADQVTNSIAGLDPTNILAVWVYRTTGTTGTPPASCTSSVWPTYCVPFTWDGTKLATTFSGNWPSTKQNACGDTSRDALGVFVKYKHSGMGFFFKNAIVSESTVMWLEPTTSAICKPLTP